MIRKGEKEIARLQVQQTAEVQRRNESFTAMIQARAVRKQAKQVLRNMSRDTKVWPARDHSAL